MKKIGSITLFFSIVFILLFGMMFVSGTAHAQTFNNSSWRKQYDPVYSKNTCVIFAFGKKSVSYLMMDMTSGEISEAEGVFETKSDSLFLHFDGAYLAFSLEWINKNKVKISNKPGLYFYLSAMNSVEDTYAHDFAEAASKE